MHKWDPHFLLSGSVLHLEAQRREEECQNSDYSQKYENEELRVKVIFLIYSWELQWVVQFPYIGKDSGNA